MPAVPVGDPGAEGAAGAAARADDPAGTAFEWDARKAEHLLNRAGFGARTAEVTRAVALGHEASVASLFAPPPDRRDPFYAEPLAFKDGGFEAAMMAPSDRRATRERALDAGALKRANAEAFKQLKERDVAQRIAFLDGWVEAMLTGVDPLRERMTLFWHGHFTSSVRDVKSSYEMIRQNELFRAHATGHFSDLLYGITRDAAMLEYLDNDSNRKSSPNENFARELLELFTLGEGRYTEEDVKEAARAFTGWTDRKGEFHFDWRRHDFGYKTFLGVTGRLDGDDVVEILLEQDACAEHLAAELIAYFEGLEPAPARVAEYAAGLRASGYDVGALLRRLFLDPAFYRDEVVGARIAGPLDYLVGTARRLGVDPPPRLVVLGAAALGQRLFEPPSVQGWERGPAWITTSTLMLRGNLAGGLLGRVGHRDLFRELGSAATEPEEPEVLGRDDPRATSADDAPDGPAAEPGDGPDDGSPPGTRRRKRRDALRVLERAGWSPAIHLTARLERAGALDDGSIADVLLEELLAIEPTASIRGEALALLRERRRELGLADGELLEARADSERVLRELAHLVLSLPEAHLH